MHVMAKTENEFLSIDVVRVIHPQTENDLEWLVCDVEWQRLNQQFRTKSECFTTSEWKEFIEWLEGLNSEKEDSVISFIEPSIHCIWLQASEVVVFVLWLELTPTGQERLPVALAFPRRAITVHQ